MHMHRCTSFRYARGTCVDMKYAVWSQTTRRRSGVSPEGGRTAEATEDLAQWSEGPKALQKLTLT